jgi:Zinc-binding dehydrogenase
MVPMQNTQLDNLRGPPTPPGGTTMTAGKVAPVIDRSYPLDDSVAAIRRMLDGHACDKIVISVASRNEPAPAPGSTT